MKKVIKKHPLAIRWFHWINFPVIAIMIWSGMLIYWANDVYKVGWGNKTILKFFPDSFYKALHIPFRLAEGMSLHFVFMWLFAINGFIYVLYLIFSGEWRLIFPNKKSLKESFLVVLHDLHIRKAAPPQKKYNAAQRIAYTGVIVMGIGSLLTGLSIYKPIQFHTLCSLLGGYEWARAEHFILTILFTLFFVVHIVQVILAGWNNFRSMVTGLDVLPIANNILKPATISSGEDRHEAIPPVMKIAKSETIPNDAPADNVILEENNQVEKAGEPDSAGGFNDDHSAENDISENQEEAGK
ncbi:MAG TPA: cytochrome b/b6 domain-containing protein [Ginsengibacter sp.]|nr:cytochrome b/b6 domain-containing protein [Ginsengibacter sp.]